MMDSSKQQPAQRRELPLKSAECIAKTKELVDAAPKVVERGRTSSEEVKPTVN